MNTITNNEFKMLYTLIEKISSECSKKFKFKTITYLNMTEFNSLSFLFTIKYKGEMHTVERNLHRMEIMTANYEIYDSLMNYIDGVYKELRKKIEEDITPKNPKELKDNIKNKTWGAEPDVKALKNPHPEDPDWWKKQLFGDFDEI